MSGNAEEAYEVGYKKPPKATRFQKGKSGYPAGRRKKKAEPLDPGGILDAVDNEEIVVFDNGKRKSMRKIEIEYRQQFAKAAKGDLKTARLLMQMATDYFAPDANPDCKNEFLTAAQAEQRFGADWIQILTERNALCRGRG
jgi:hypothetical protein